MHLRLISIAIFLCLLVSCQQDKQDPGTLVPVDQIPINQDIAEQDKQLLPPVDPPVGDLSEDNGNNGQDAASSIAIPQGTTQWPNGTDFPPEVIQMLEKYYAGESLTSDEEVTLRGFDQKWRNWDEIEAIGKSQSDS
ncbi:MAG: hypothetical protein H7A35_13625 [Planctomycetales bacterium]|nr:hypothetical protein [bacterium]UNM07882.1 MAG: hypothetical protein H7A35_13625 [Planctomycetales bacterium]